MLLATDVDYSTVRRETERILSWWIVFFHSLALFRSVCLLQTSVSLLVLSPTAATVAHLVGIPHSWYHLIESIVSFVQFSLFLRYRENLPLLVDIKGVLDLVKIFRQSRRLHRERERSILIDWASWQSNVVMKSKKMDKQKWINQAIFEQQLFIASQRRLILAISLTGSPTIERTPSSLQSRTNQSNYTCSTCTHRKRKKEGREVKKRRHRRRRRRRRRG